MKKTYRTGRRTKASLAEKPRRRPGTSPAFRFPEFCDFNCTFAAFSSPDAAGACRREEAVYCTYLKRFSRKHGRCLARGGAS